MSLSEDSLATDGKSFIDTHTHSHTRTHTHNWRSHLLSLSIIYFIIIIIIFFVRYTFSPLIGGCRYWSHIGRNMAFWWRVCQRPDKISHHSETQTQYRSFDKRTRKRRGTEPTHRSIYLFIYIYINMSVCVCVCVCVGVCVCLCLYLEKEKEIKRL